MNTYLKKVLNILKNYWFGIILFIIGIVSMLQYGLLHTVILSNYGTIVFLYFVSKSSFANGLIRHYFNMRTEEDEQKTKRRKNVYEAKAKAKGYAVGKPTFNKTKRK